MFRKKFRPCGPFFTEDEWSIYFFQTGLGLRFKMLGINRPDLWYYYIKGPVWGFSKVLVTGSRSRMDYVGQSLKVHSRKIRSSNLTVSTIFGPQAQLYLLSNTPRPFCTQCNIQYTIQHILLDCPLFMLARQTAGITNSFQQIFSSSQPSVKSLLHFLRLINFSP